MIMLSESCSFVGLRTQHMSTLASFETDPSESFSLLGMFISLVPRPFPLPVFIASSMKCGGGRSDEILVVGVAWERG